MYELKEYLKAINQSKERLMDGEDEVWEKKYPAYIVNNIEYVKEYYGYSNEKAKSALTILNDEQIEFIKNKLNKGGRHGK